MFRIGGTASARSWMKRPRSRCFLRFVSIAIRVQRSSRHSLHQWTASDLLAMQALPARVAVRASLSCRNATSTSVTGHASMARTAPRFRRRSYATSQGSAVHPMAQSSRPGGSSSSAGRQSWSTVTALSLATLTGAIVSILMQYTESSFLSVVRPVPQSMPSRPISSEQRAMPFKLMHRVWPRIKATSLPGAIRRPQWQTLKKPWRN